MKSSRNLNLNRKKNQSSKQSKLTKKNLFLSRGNHLASLMIKRSYTRIPITKARKCINLNRSCHKFRNRIRSRNSLVAKKHLQSQNNRNKKSSIRKKK